MIMILYQNNRIQIKYLQIKIIFNHKINKKYKKMRMKFWIIIYKIIKLFTN